MKKIRYYSKFAQNYINGIEWFFAEFNDLSDEKFYIHPKGYDLWHIKNSLYKILGN